MKARRRLIASMVFDFETAPNYREGATVKWVFDFENEERPIQIVVEHKMETQEFTYELNDAMRTMVSRGEVTSLSKELVKEAFPDYPYPINIDDADFFHISEFGHGLICFDDFKSALKWHNRRRGIK